MNQRRKKKPLALSGLGMCLGTLVSSFGESCVGLFLSWVGRDGVVSVVAA